MLEKFQSIWTSFAYTSFAMPNLVWKLNIDVVLKWIDEMSLILVEESYLGIWRCWKNFSSFGYPMKVHPSQSFNRDRN